MWRGGLSFNLLLPPLSSGGAPRLQVVLISGYFDDPTLFNEVPSMATGYGVGPAMAEGRPDWEKRIHCCPASIFDPGIASNLKPAVTKL